MPFSGSGSTGAARGVRLASFEPGFTARRSLCFETADAKVCSLLALGRCGVAVGQSYTWERTRRFSSGLPVDLSVSHGELQVNPNEVAAAPSP